MSRWTTTISIAEAKIRNWHDRGDGLGVADGLDVRAWGDRAASDPAEQAPVQPQLEHHGPTSEREHRSVVDVGHRFLTRPLRPAGFGAGARLRRVPWQSSRIARPASRRTTGRPVGAGLGP